MYTKHRWNTDKYYSFQYVKYLPKDYDPQKKYPLVFFLHGAGERGDDLDEAMRHGYMKYVREEGREYPFVFIAPQCPKNKYWGCYTESLIAFLDAIIAELSVDEKRVYLTGLSMGGTGTWMLAMACPEKFAAIAPVCGSGICWYGIALKELPVYAYHGDCDTTVPVAESVNMISRVNANGGQAQIKILYGMGHDSWKVAYGDDELWQWMLKHRRHCTKEEL